MLKFDAKTWEKGQKYLEDSLNSMRGNAYKELKLLSIDNPYIFEIEYDRIDYDYANEYFKLDNTPMDGKCSGCHAGNFYGRNLDWGYNNDADFIVKIPRVEDRYASIGMAFVTGFTAKEARKKEYNDVYNILPFYTVDGENEFGLYVQTNVVPIADNPKKTTKTGQKGKPEISMKMVCRYILDHYRTPEEAIEGLKNNVRIVTSDAYTKGGFEAHWFVGNSEKSYVVEIINNEVVATETNIITNFYINGIILNSDGSLYSIKNNTEGSCPAIEINNLKKYSDGVERWNIINAGLSGISSVDSMFDLMAQVNYTNAYDISDTSKFWYSEYTGPNILGIDVNNTWLPEYFTEFLPIIRAMYENRTREDGGTWQTVHQCVYDIENRKVYIKSQQNELEDKIYEFELEVK